MSVMTGVYKLDFRFLALFGGIAFGHEVAGTRGTGVPVAATGPVGISPALPGQGALIIKAYEDVTYAAASANPRLGEPRIPDHYVLLGPRPSWAMAANSGIYSTENSEEPLDKA